MLGLFFNIFVLKLFFNIYTPVIISLINMILMFFLSILYFEFPPT